MFQNWLILPFIILSVPTFAEVNVPNDTVTDLRIDNETESIAVDEQKTTIQQTETERRRLEQEKHKLESQIAQNISKGKELQSEITRLNKSYLVIAKQEHLTEVRAKQWQAANDKLSARVDELKKQTESIEAKQKEAEERVAKSESDINDLKTQQRSLIARKAKAEQKMRQAQMKQQQLAKIKKTVQNKNKSLEKVM